MWVLGHPQLMLATSMSVMDATEEGTPMAVSLTVNGKSYTVEVPPEMPLLWVLRDVIGLTGTKFGCGMAQCGACTVHVDGIATRSCILAVGTVSGAVTIIQCLSA